MAVNLSYQITSSEDNKIPKVTLEQKINNFLYKIQGVPLKERLFFVQHLKVMLKSGISLSIALKTLASSTKNKFFIKIITDVSGKVEKGQSFSESLKPYQKIFGEMFVKMVEAGELSGKLEEVLSQLFIQMKKEHTLISKVKGALTYPAVIMAAMGGIGVFMFIFIIPKITAMFSEMQVELPLATKILINSSNAVVKHGILSLILVIAVIITFIQIIRTQKGKYALQSLLLKMPIISPIIKKINLARFARNISSLLKTDIMIVQTFEITASVLGNLHYKKALIDMSQKLKKGGKLSEVVLSYPKLFTPVVAQMIAVGEETGELDNVLVELAEFYEEEIDQIMENLPAIIEPLLILVLGLGVGGVAVAIIMPMYSLTSAV